MVGMARIPASHLPMVTRVTLIASASSACVKASSVSRMLWNSFGAIFLRCRCCRVFAMNVEGSTGAGKVSNGYAAENLEGRRVIRPAAFFEANHARTSV